MKKWEENKIMMINKMIKKRTSATVSIIQQMHWVPCSCSVGMEIQEFVSLGAAQVIKSDSSAD